MTRGPIALAAVTAMTSLLATPAPSAVTPVPATGANQGATAAQRGDPPRLVHSYHTDCQQSSYGHPVKKSGNHLHSRSKKYGAPCIPPAALPAPQPQTLSPGKLTNPQLQNKQ